jgi:hypothetical protein
VHRTGFWAYICALEEQYLQITGLSNTQGKLQHLLASAEVDMTRKVSAPEICAAQ